MNVTIPKGDFEGPAPCWIPTATRDGRPLKPLIKCQCGAYCGIALHHVHADGRVTASFFHDKNPQPAIGYPGGGCGWHVFLQLENYDQGEFLPKK